MEYSPQQHPQQQQIPYKSNRVTPGLKIVFLIFLFPFAMIFIIFEQFLYRPVIIIKKQCNKADDLVKIAIGVVSPIMYVLAGALGLLQCPVVICKNLSNYCSYDDFNIAVKSLFWYEGSSCVDYLCLGENWDTIYTVPAPNLRHVQYQDMQYQPQMVVQQQQQPEKSGKKHKEKIKIAGVTVLQVEAKQDDFNHAKVKVKVPCC